MSTRLVSTSNIIPWEKRDIPLNRRNPKHNRADETWKHLLEPQVSLTSSHVLIENKGGRDGWVCMVST